MKISCPSCEVELQVRDSLAGRRVKCPHCAEMFRIEEQETAEELLEFEDVAEDSPATRRAAKSPPESGLNCPMCGAANRRLAEECRECGEPLSKRRAPGKGVWSDGNRLVMHKKSELPYRCIKTNEPADVLIRRKLYWHHPAIYVAVISPVIYIILALALQKKAVVEIPVCYRIRQRRRIALAIAWLCGLGGIAMLVLGFALAGGGPQNDYWPLIGLLGFLAAIVAVVISLQVGNLVAATKIDEKYVCLKGAHPAYLAELTEWVEED